MANKVKTAASKVATEKGEASARHDLVVQLLSDPSGDRVRFNTFFRQDQLKKDETARTRNYANPEPVWASKSQIEKLMQNGVVSSYADKNGKEVTTVAFSGNMMRGQEHGNPPKRDWIPNFDTASDSYTAANNRTYKVKPFDQAAYDKQAANMEAAREAAKKEREAAKELAPDETTPQADASAEFGG